MIDWRDPDGRLLMAIPPRMLARWGAAIVVVIAVHAAAVWLAMHWRSAAAASGEPPPAVMIDLSPMSVAPETPPQEIAPGPQMTEAQPETAPAQQETPQPEATPAPTPPPPEPDVKVPDLPKVDDAAATLTPPPPEPPKPPKEVERKPTTPPPKKKIERKRPLAHADHAAPRTSAPPTAQAQRAERTAAATGAGAASSAAAAASWRSALMAHLNRYKRFPSGAGGGGVATIAFTINRSGQVTSSRLLRSSGDSVLDAEAVALPRRASPVPAPPPGGAGSIGLAVPIRFSR